MKMNVNFNRFVDAFESMNRGDNFSYEALRALFDYLEELEQDLGEEIKLDVIALCCEFSEIYEDEEAYKEYIGEGARYEDLIIATLSNSILVLAG